MKPKGVWHYANLVELFLPVPHRFNSSYVLRMKAAHEQFHIKVEVSVKT